MNNKIYRLEKIISEIDDLISKNVTSSDVSFTKWKNMAKSVLISIYGEKHYQCKEFDKIAFYEFDYGELNGYGPTIDQVEVCKQGLLSAKGLLENVMDLLEDESQQKFFKKQSVSKNFQYDKVFIVHGHDGELKQSVARVVEKQNIEAIILSEKGNKGRTIIEKFEDYSDVSGAICLFTADDLGKTKNDTIESARARQNVVLETGYFMGRLGRDRVVILADKGIEMPSDLSGVVYTNTESWEFELLKELKVIGYKVDLNKLL